MVGVFVDRQSDFFMQKKFLLFYKNIFDIHIVREKIDLAFYAK